MNLAEFSMRYRPVVLTLITLLTVWGVLTYLGMPRREDPEFTIRTCVVSTRWPGTPTVKVEELVTDKLEEALEGLEEVDKLESTTINGLSTINVDLTDDVPVADIQNVWDKVRAKVDLVQMPATGIRPIVNDSFGDTSVMLLAIYQKPMPNLDKRIVYSPRQLELFADQVKDAFRLLPGVAEVKKYGVNEEAIYIESDLGTWSQIELTAGALRRLVEERNIVSPGGSIDTEAGKFNVKPGGEFDTLSQIESITVGSVVTGNSVKPVLLKEAGLSVVRGYQDPPKELARFSNSEGSYPAVMLGVTMKSGSNIVTVCETCMARYRKLADVEQVLPKDLGVAEVSMQSDNVTAKINDVISNVISAIVIVVIVVFLFVGFRTSMVMAANIPIVVMSSIAVIAWFGVELEQISLASIIIALGLLVDNAVQVCDQTRVNMVAGLKPREAAVEAAKTLMVPMLIGTLTTVAAFFPMLFSLKGGGAEYVYSLPVTLSVTLILSWIFAMSICVILAAAIIRVPDNPDIPSAPLPWLMYASGKAFAYLRFRFSKNQTGPQAVPEANGENIFLRFYGVTAQLAIKFKWIVVAATIGLLCLVLQLDIASEFFPQDRRDQFFVNVTLPETATIEQTAAVVEQLELAIRALSPITNEAGDPVQRLRAMRSLTGGGGARWALGVSPPSPAANVAQLLVRTTGGAYTPGFIEDIRRVANEGDASLRIMGVDGVELVGIDAIPGARIVPKSLSLGPPAEPVVIRVSGNGFADIGELRRIANKVKDLVREDPGAWDVNDSWGVDGFQIDLDIDEEKANLAGVTNANVADSLNAYFTGVELSKFREGDHQIPVYFRIAHDQRQTLAGLDSAYVEGENGKLPLNAIAEIRPSWQPAKIERRNSNRTIEVKAEVESGVSGNDVVLGIMDSDRMKSLIQNLPSGLKIEVGGSYEESQDSSKQMLTSFGISFLAIIFILVVQYNGWSKMLLILTTLPMAMVGALFGLWFTDNALGFMPQLGLLSLFGIVLNTGIIFIEFADILIAKKSSEGDGSGPISGLTKEEFRTCLVEAGKQRMLPIFLTTATTVGGLIPLALSGGPLWEGLAWLMIYGLLVATVLTLYVVPSLYAIIVETFRIAPVAVDKA
ncbi:MAG: multidrug efflux pump subunit AcrB [Mariniblastus sp.]|jgi:multidrug efflux pump subunit AcrB